ncbi:unnamed protein product [Calicophoron daubneyi]
MEADVQVRLVKPARYEDIRIGQEVEFACEAKANPPLGPANIKWYHNGNARLPNTEFRRNGNLRIAVLGIEHTGSYHCRVVHAAGKLDSRPPYVLQLNDENPPKLITSLAHSDFSRFVMRGKSVELSCPKLGAQKLVDGIPPITVWGFMQRLGEQQQSVSSLPDLELVDQDSKLIISNFDVQHANFYICETSWPGAPDKYVFLFQVEMATLYTPKRSDFSPRLKKNQPYVVQINGNAELRYYSDQSPSNSFFVDQMSNPAPHIEWYKKDEHQPIQVWPEPTESRALTPPPRRYALRGRHLILNQVTEMDSGTYEMVLTNVAGRVSIPFDILVTFPPEFHQPQTHEEHSFDEDESVTLDCGIKRRSDPGSIVYWEKDQRVLKKYTNSLMLLEDDGETLRFPQLKPEDQGQYQCFVQTDGYEKRAAGREQTLIVKAKLQFLREMREHFLEVNTQGRIPCKARGYGTLKVDWFRKVGPGETDLQPIRPPNQVEGGTLIIQYVQKQDAGDYICVAQSTYRNARINMSVKVIVGEKPQITQISSNQTVRVGSQLILNCHATGDPPPQVSWIVKKVGYKVPSVYTPVVIASEDGGMGSGQSDGQNQKELNSEKQDFSPQSADNVINGASNPNSIVASMLVRTMPVDAGRVTAFQNGSLVINQAHLVDQAEYICVAGNKHAIKTRQGVFIRVLTPEEYTRRQLGEEGTSGSGMVKTIITVVGCAVTYLGLIIGLTVFCSMRMLRTRRKRSRKAIKMHENGQLLTPMGDPAGLNGGTMLSQTTSNCCPNAQLETGLLVPGLGGVPASAGGTVPFTHLSHHSQPLLINAAGGMRNGSTYADATNDVRFNTVNPSGLGVNSAGSACSQIPSTLPKDNQEWWPWKNQAYLHNGDLRTANPVPGNPSTPVDGLNDSMVDGGNPNARAYVSSHQMASPACGLVYNGLGGLSPGVESSTIATTASESQLMSAPPPTPLDSRSHFSGLSSGNSTSLYSRSLLSGASNLGPPAGGGGVQNVSENSPSYGVPSDAHPISQADRMNYPRCELKMEGILGKGEFGDVFLARARHIKEDESQSLVLVKSLVSHDPTHINEFHRQLELFGKVNHDYVTRLLGICMDQEPFYMLLEYCEWGDLKMFLRRIREDSAQAFKTPSLTHAQKLRMCKQLALGMDHLAQMRCVHRDLASRNILLTQDMELKISSLGLARDVYANEYYRVPNTEHFIPLRWFAPELIVAATSEGNYNRSNGSGGFSSSLPYSTSSDVWAFAVLVCEVFSLATLPLARLTDCEIIAAGKQTAVQASSENGSKDNTLTGQVPLRPDMPAEIPSELSNMLSLCWSPAPQHRPNFREISVLMHKLTS